MKQIQCDEHAKHAGGKQEKKRKELTRPIINFPRDEHAGEHNNSGQQHHRQA